MSLRHHHQRGLVMVRRTKQLTFMKLPPRKSRNWTWALCSACIAWEAFRSRARRTTWAVLWAFTLRGEFSVRHSRPQPLSLTEDCANPLHCANPFQAALQDAKKESSRAGKLKYRFQTKFLRFRVQLEVLFVDMRSTAWRYFRYLLPNSTRGQEP